MLVPHKVDVAQFSSAMNSLCKPKGAGRQFSHLVPSRSSLKNELVFIFFKLSLSHTTVLTDGSDKLSWPVMSVGGYCCRFFLQTLTAAKASCICFPRASLWRLYAISMNIKKIPAAMPPATSMKTPAIFSKVSVAGALLLESHSWYLTQVLSRSSMNPFSWELRIARDTFCFQGLSLRMPMPKPERKNSSPVVTRSHFCEASNSSTAESQMKACSLLLGQGEGRRVGRMGGYGATVQWETTHWWHPHPHPPLLCYQKSRPPPHRQMKSNAGRVELCPPLDSLNDVFAENLKDVCFSLLLTYGASSPLLAWVMGQDHRSVQ